MICSGNERKIRCRQSFQVKWHLLAHTERRKVCNEEKHELRETRVKNDKSDKKRNKLS